MIFEKLLPTKFNHIQVPRDMMMNRKYSIVMPLPSWCGFNFSSHI
jgi:hypothetical protein